MITEKTITTDSSMIKKAVYNFLTGQLNIEFQSGMVYEYCNVDTVTYDEFCASPSQGKFFNERIKNQFEYSKLLHS